MVNATVGPLQRACNMANYMKLKGKIVSSYPVEKTEDIALARKARREAFLEQAGWRGVSLEPMQADASFRRYYRVQGGTKPALLMEDPPDRPPVPPFVMVEPFVNIAAHLSGNCGVRAPGIYAQDIKNGLLLIEDFGDDTYTRLLNAGASAEPLYKLAVDALIDIHKTQDHGAARVDAYDVKALNAEAELFLDWYYPALTGHKATPDMRSDFKNVWERLFERLPKDQETLVLRDYHVDNLILLKKGGVGVLDFQDALIGQKSYDLMSLLEDARRDVPENIQRGMIDYYVSKTGVDRREFMDSYKILSAQRHAKVLGIFVRLFERDGKDRYLQFLPHVQKLFLKSLEDPVLAPLSDWMKKYGVPVEQPVQKFTRAPQHNHKEGPKP